MFSISVLIQTIVRRLGEMLAEANSFTNLPAQTSNYCSDGLARLIDTLVARGAARHSSVWAQSTAAGAIRNLRKYGKYRQFLDFPSASIPS
jgi:hypothetical protein